MITPYNRTYEVSSQSVVQVSKARERSLKEGAKLVSSLDARIQTLEEEIRIKTENASAYTSSLTNLYSTHQALKQCALVNHVSHVMTTACLNSVRSEIASRGYS